MPHGLTCRPIWWGYFHSWRSLFLVDFNLRPGDKELKHGLLCDFCLLVGQDQVTGKEMISGVGDYNGSCHKYLCILNVVSYLLGANTKELVGGHVLSRGFSDLLLQGRKPVPYCFSVAPHSRLALAGALRVSSSSPTQCSPSAWHGAFLSRWFSFSGQWYTSFYTLLSICKLPPVKCPLEGCLPF